jgi:hypothetical protein
MVVGVESPPPKNHSCYPQRKTVKKQLT